MGMTEFLGGEYDGDFPRPGPLPFKPASGPRLAHMTQLVKVAEIENASDHEVKMSEFAARATRWFAEHPEEVQWHTLAFRVIRSGMEDEHEYAWQWSVWVS